MFCAAAARKDCSQWNGKLLMEGGGGLVGSINTEGMTHAVREGYASASTDTGHSGRGGNFALGHPDKIIDFAYRAVHETVLQAKALIAAYYGRGPRLSYWEGCSTGGRQALMSAQRYPEDFDAIIAGAPAYNQIHISAWRMRLETVSTAYSELRSSTGELLYPGFPFGGELGWRLPAGATEPGAIDVDIFRYIGNQHPAWDWRTFELEKDVDRALLHGKEIHAVNPDLTKFKARGGKLFMYHGWSDRGSGGSISPLNTISYYNSVLKQMGPNQDDWFRLFMVPGMDGSLRGRDRTQSVQ